MDSRRHLHQHDRPNRPATGRPSTRIAFGMAHGLSIRSTSSTNATQSRRIGDRHRGDEGRVSGRTLIKPPTTTEIESRFTTT